MRQEKKFAHVLVLEPSHFIVEGIKAIARPEPGISNVVMVNNLMELARRLDDAEKQIIIMELYNHTDNVCDSVRFILKVRTYYRHHRWIILTDVLHQGIPRLFSHDADITLLDKSATLGSLAGVLNDYGAPGARRKELCRQLSDGEWQVLQLMVRGRHEQDISTRLNRSYKTISSHKLNIMRKLRLGKTDFSRLLIELRRRALA